MVAEQLKPKSQMIAWAAAACALFPLPARLLEAVRELLLAHLRLGQECSGFDQNWMVEVCLLCLVVCKLSQPSTSIVLRQPDWPGEGFNQRHITASHRIERAW